MGNKKLLKRKRLATLIDISIFILIVAPVFLLDIMLFGTYDKLQNYDRETVFLIKNAFQLYVFLIILLFLFKDSIQGQSLGKKLTKLAVVDSATNKASFKKSLSRNIIGILSIGDIYTNTKIISRKLK